MQKIKIILKKIWGKIWGFVKKHKILSIIIAIILLIGGFVMASGGDELKTEVLEVVPVTVAEEISVTGRVESAEKVELAIESGGKIVAINVIVGQEIIKGQTLLRVNSDDLWVRLARQETELERSKIALNKQETKTNSEDDLKIAYEDGFNIVSETFLDLPSIITDLDDVLSHNYISRDVTSLRYGNAAKDLRKETTKAYFAAKRQFETMQKLYRTLDRESETEAIGSLIEQTYEVAKDVADVVKKVNNLVDLVENRIIDQDLPEELVEDQETLDGFTDSINTHLSELFEIIDDIKNFKEGITDEDKDIESLKIDVRQAELDIEDTQIAINHRAIRSPINGVVTEVLAEVGETISQNEPVISLISLNEYEIEANLPEADIAKMKVGALADVTLDAYGNDVVFTAIVVSVNPAETLLDGVATYKTTFEFTLPDNRIKSGMTADITVKGEKKENVLAVPGRSVISRDGQKFVQVQNIDGTIAEKIVKTGLRGSDGNVEITEGLAEGDKVIVFTETK
ncbi:MAG: efflux RND transporter periplasmic adaptor subunit [Patescibacteria group bacterium]|mgnify:CR=1 FL=1